jgi:hypothetical protein
MIVTSIIGPSDAIIVLEQADRVIELDRHAGSATLRARRLLADLLSHCR